MNPLQLLDMLRPDAGLSCLPFCTKVAELQRFEAVMKKQGKDAAAEWASKNWLARLMFLSAYIEPLTLPPEAGGSMVFGQLCQALGGATEPEQVAQAFRLQVPKPFSPSAWVMWAAQLVAEPAACLFCAANAWMCPTKDPVVPPEVGALTLTLMGRSMSALGAPLFAVRAMTAWAHLQDECYPSVKALREAMTRSPLYRQVEVTTRANFVDILAKAFLALDGEGSRRAGMLIEAWLAVPVPSFATAPALRGVPIAVSISCLQSWLRGFPLTHPDCLPTCEAVAAYLRGLRDEQFPTRSDRRSCDGSIFNMRNSLLDLAQRKAESDRAAGNLAEAEKAEQRLFVWLEELESRMLLLSDSLFHKEGRIGTDHAALLGPSWKPGTWPLRRRTEPNLSHFHGGYLPPVDPFVFDKPCAPRPLSWSDSPNTAAVLASQVETQRQTGVDSIQSDLWRLMAKPAEMSSLIPPGVLLVRTVFEVDGKLSWWVLRRDEGVRVVAQGGSKAGARRRAEFANVSLNIALERIWANHVLQGSVLSPGELAELRQLGELCADRKKADLRRSQKADFFRWMQRILELVTKLGPGRYQLSGVGRFLMEALAKYGTFDEYLGLWNENLSLLATPHTTPLGHPQRETERRQALDAAFTAHLKAVQADFDLSPLWQATGDSFPWHETDVLWQVQGALAAAPLAWLDLAGQPLFRRTASTSSVPSLTFRQLAATQAEQAGPPSPHLLSAHWLPPEQWHRMSGLGNLHAGLRVLGPKHNWQVWGLSDEPQASLRHVCGALNRRESPFGLAVVGGRGHMDTLGLALGSDTGELWTGQGANLSKLDLLILASCAVGRLRPDASNIPEMYASLVARGLRSALLARWPVADLDAATFVTEVVNQYLAALPKDGPAPPFARARALNRARKAMLGHTDAAVRVSDHLVSAYEVYGLG